MLSNTNESIFFILVFHRSLFHLGLCLNFSQLEEVHVELDETLREQDLDVEG